MSVGLKGKYMSIQLVFTVFILEGKSTTKGFKNDDSINLYL